MTIVDACLRDGRGGSPTAVLEDGPFTDGDRCGVAARAGTSHAVFVTREGEDAASLRFFTAKGELPGCGHGTIAALALLAAEGGRDAVRMTLRTAHGSFAGEATRSGDRFTASFEPGAVTLRAASEAERGVVRDAFDAEQDVLPDEVCAASIGRPRLLVPVRTPAALARLRPDQDRLRAACDRLGLLGCYVYAHTAEGRLAARMFAPSIGVEEDIANANSTACLAARLGRERITVDMGDHVGRPATITATSRHVDGSLQLRVGGDARVAGVT